MQFMQVQVICLTQKRANLFHYLHAEQGCYANTDLNHCHAITQVAPCAREQLQKR